ncbi:granulocyte-macrophage colony-stimulating factor receptor subunit alpha [Talpa occidentalis]|uniref:granulocyte-macrophage colony-stimulating factor receptor subunit alpha n=1 Tax=Talpa occidentalis TaxID=50954 RepID=UPI0018900938|nr:granulocyte-macrophage colony-stimulating factor receptor subunit alpha [Talpa occidentalis]
MKFDPWNMTLSWDCREDVMGMECEMIHKEEGRIKKKLEPMDCECSFEDYTLHLGVTLVLTVNTSHGEVKEELPYTNPGKEGTAAQNFSCFIYDVEFMNCSWAKGPAAPDDVQYFLYMQLSQHPNGRECPLYVDASGTHVGCHLHDLSGLGSSSYILLNGTSRRTGIQFLDLSLETKEIEVYTVPHNISVTCNASHCNVSWGQPRTFRKMTTWDFLYQLDICRLGDSKNDEEMLIDVPLDLGRKYEFPSPEPRGRHSVRVRWANIRFGPWSAWSAPVHFGSEQQETSPVFLYLAIMLGTLVGAVLLGLLFNRVLGRCRLFPPVPRIRDKWTCTPADQQISWEALTKGAGKGDVEDVLTVQEVTAAHAAP